MASKIKKPPEVRERPFQSALWNQLVKDHDLKPSQAATLGIYCHWQEVARDASARMLDEGGNLALVVGIDGAPAPNPYLKVLERADAQIERLGKVLGIAPGAAPRQRRTETEPAREEPAPAGGGDAEVLKLVQGNRARRRAEAQA